MMATKADRESETTRIGEGVEGGELTMNLRAKRIAKSSAENIEVIRGSLNVLWI